MNVLSLFDGMSCGQQALEKAGIKVNNYFASEIDKYAIKVTMANYPNTIQLGSIVDVDGYKLPKIDLLIGGSPCQSFSFAGKRKGMSTKNEIEILTLEHYLELKKDDYQFEGQSYLFWEFMRLLNEVKPKYFLLENVIMGEKWEKILSKAIGVNAIEINSSLLSAQNRRRLYWTNIGMVPAGLFGDLTSIIQQPKDKNIYLKDILENEVPDKYYLSDAMIKRVNRSKHGYKSFQMNNKSLCLLSGYAKSGYDNQYIIHNTMPRSSQNGKGGTGALSRQDGKTYCLDTGNTNAIEIKAIKLGQSEAWGSPEKNDGKSYTICKEQPHGIVYDSKIRRFLPIECERLQTVKENYTNCVSDTQRYKMLGNGWTVDVIVHIFKYIN